MSENEFGVPFPGRVVPKEQWTRTALKALPEGLLDFAALFGRAAPVVLDLGCGNGRFAIASALARPECDHLGVDILPLVIRYARKRANQRGLANVRFAVAGAHELLAKHIAEQSIAEIHLYHPQPYRDGVGAERRLLSPEFLGLAHRALRPGGLLVIQTDNRGYWQYLKAVLPALFAIREQRAPWPDAPAGRTRREIYARKHGMPIYAAEARPLPLSAAEREAIVAALPPVQEAF
jgi:tRNA (guanine-N7-)-methyltransferase